MQEARGIMNLSGNNTLTGLYSLTGPSVWYKVCDLGEIWYWGRQEEVVLLASLVCVHPPISYVTVWIWKCNRHPWSVCVCLEAIDLFCEKAFLSLRSWCACKQRHQFGVLNIISSGIKLLQLLLHKQWEAYSLRFKYHPSVESTPGTLLSSSKNTNKI